MSKSERDTLLPESPCPYCRVILDAAYNPISDDKPEPGDITVCISCASPLVLDQNLRLRKPYMGEIAASPELDRIMKAIRSIDRRKRE